MGDGMGLPVVEIPLAGPRVAVHDEDDGRLGRVPVRHVIANGDRPVGVAAGVVEGELAGARVERGDFAATATGQRYCCQ